MFGSSIFIDSNINVYAQIEEVRHTNTLPQTLYSYIRQQNKNQHSVRFLQISKNERYVNRCFRIYTDSNKVLQRQFYIIRRQHLNSDGFWQMMYEMQGTNNAESNLESSDTELTINGWVSKQNEFKKFSDEKIKLRLIRPNKQDLDDTILKAYNLKKMWIISQ